DKDSAKPSCPCQRQDQTWLGGPQHRHHRTPDRATTTAETTRFQHRHCLRHLVQYLRSLPPNWRLRLFSSHGSHVLGRTGE
ncbi:hypothetical protein LTR60_006606, partial [Cryomyces antarcticus]